MKNDVCKKEINRLKRIEGQVRGIINMIEKKSYCIDVLTQIKAIKSSLGSLEAIILRNHLESCVKEAFETDEYQSQEKIEELLKLLKQ